MARIKKLQETKNFPRVRLGCAMQADGVADVTAGTSVVFDRVVTQS